jgi:hypothetical protein
MRTFGVIGALAAISSVACAGSGGGGGGVGKPVAVFPSKAELAEVMKGEAKPVARMDTVEVPSWRIETPVPALGTAYPAETDWDRLLAAYVARTGRGKLSTELRCAALETARFYVSAGGFPDDGTRRYLAERCGYAGPPLRISTSTGEANDQVTDAALATQAEPSIKELLDKSSIGASSELALGVARGSGRVGIVVYVGQPGARFVRFNPLVTGDSVTVEGTVSADSAFALGLVNEGATGVRACEPDRSVALPQFRLACPFSAADEQARIEVATRKPGRVLMEIELGALVRRTEEAGLVYAPGAHGSTAPAADADAFGAVLFGELNDARAAARAPALVFEARQSAVNQKLAPHLFHAASSGQAELADRIGLGVMAGWEVGGLIRDGGVYWGIVTSTRSPARFVSYALESPLGRSILLDPKMSRVAVGVTGIEPAGAMALLTTYSFFQSKDHGVEENSVFQELVKRRQANRHSSPARTSKEQALERALARVASKEATTAEALEAAMREINQYENVSVSGWLAETNDLRQIPWSKDLLEREPLDVEIGVTHYKAPGGAWAQYAVLVIVRGPGAGQMAASGARPMF